MENNVVNSKIEVLDSNICQNCKYIQITAREPNYIYANGEIAAVSWGDHKFYCSNINMCKYLQKLFASDTTPKVEE